MNERIRRLLVNFPNQFSKEEVVQSLVNDQFAKGAVSYMLESMLLSGVVVDENGKLSLNRLFQALPSVPHSAETSD